MQKRIINPVQEQNVYSDQNWLDIEKLAVAEVTSEDGAYPIESALLSGNDSGWARLKSGKTDDKAYLRQSSEAQIDQAELRRV